MDKAYKRFSINNIRFGRHILLAVLFFIYNFTYSSVSSSFYFLINKFFNEKDSIFYNNLLLLFFAASLIIFGLLLSLMDISPYRLSRLMGVITLIMPLFMLFLFKTGNAHIFLASSYILLFIIGALCVYYYKLMYRAFSYMSHTGCVYIVSMSCTILLQYYLQSYIKNDNLILYSILLMAFVAAFLNLSGIVNYLSDTEPEEVINSRPPKSTNFKFIYIGMLIVIIAFEFIGNFLSYPLLILMYNGEALVYESPRLFIIFSYIIMGIISDIKDMKYIPVVTSAIVLFGILNPVLMSEDSSIYANTCIYYIVAGVINSFFVLMMFKLARGHRFAPFIAVSGRIIDSIFSFIFTSHAISDFSLIIIIGIELVAIIIIMMLFAFMGMFDFGNNRPSSSRRISPSDFSRRFGMTDKETDVFTAALSFDGTMSELAKSLYMSRSVLYRNLGNICDKTGCSSFQAVKHLYYEMPEEEGDADTANASFENDADIEVNDTDIIDKNADITIKKADISANNADITIEKDDISAKEAVATVESKKATAETDSTSLSDKVKQFAKEYTLSEKESETLRVFLENPEKTQKELADMQGITLRTVQRHLSNIRIKTDAKSLVELNNLFYSQQ